ncbi:MAG TPA: hypothetical protein VFB66_06120 [Tepidisphaeraceae bacterium]|nr:hypothetical protein [Tepidisphaeraceae bacterium]
MKRRLLNLLTALSLLLCVAVMVLWVWSYWGGSFGRNWGRSDGLKVSRGGWCLSLDGGDFSLVQQVIRDTFQSEDEVREYLGFFEADAMPAGFHWSTNPQPYWIDHITAPPTFQWSWRGFGILRRSDDTDPARWYSEQYIEFPAWSLSLVTSILPGLWLLRFVRRRRRIRSTLCPSCGYDLRATPDKCPECGHTHTTTT